MNKIAFFGPAASGKTWCADYLKEAYGYSKVAFAAKLKQIAYDLFKVQGKNGTDREILQLLGQKMREIKGDVWIEYLINNIKFLRTQTDHGVWDNVVLDDLRYENEATALRADGWTLIMVTVPEEIRQWRLTTLYPDTPLSVYYHSSEREWERIVPDYVVESSTQVRTEELLDQIVAKEKFLGNNFRSF